MTSSPTKPILVRVLDGPPGCGKSTHMRRRAANEPALTLFSAPTQQLLDEAETAIREFLAEAGKPDITVVMVTSDKLKGKKDRRVPAEIEALPNEFASTKHAIALVSHEGLLSANLAGFKGWRLFVDEIPNIIDNGTMRVPALWPWMQQNYKLDPINDGEWSEVTLAAGAASAGAIQSDTFLPALGPFHRRAGGNRTLFADVRCWEDLSHKPKEVCWFSLWPITAADQFEEVMVCGSGFNASETKRLLDFGFSNEVEFEPEILPAQKDRKPRKAIIHYFTERPASSNFWNTDPNGHKCIDQISDWLKSNAPSTLLWSGNTDVRERMRSRGVQGTAERPLLAGLNCYASYSWAAIIYSAKLQPSEQRALRLFEPDKGDVRRSREFEAIVQFAFRTSLRDPASSANVHIVVYDMEQAAYLGEFLVKHDLATPTFEFEKGVGIANLGPMKAGRPAGQISPDRPAPRTAAERKRIQRARAKLLKR